MRARPFERPRMEDSITRSLANPALALTVALLAASGALAQDDRAPTAEETAQIEQALRAEGFTAWEEEVELDDGAWEVDDAVAADGQKYDLTLDPAFAVAERERD